MKHFLLGLFLTAAAFGQKPEVLRHWIVLAPVPGELRVRELLVVRNAGQQPIPPGRAGAVQVFIPEQSGGRVKAQLRLPQGRTQDCDVKPAGKANVYGLMCALQPGETSVELTWMQPFALPGEFSGNFIEKPASGVLVLPRGVGLMKADLETLGTDNETQSTFYRLKENTFTVQLTPQDMGAPEEDGPVVESIRPRIYDRLNVLLGLAGALLAIGFVWLYRRGGEAAPKA